MEQILSAIASDLLGRALSMVIQRYILPRQEKGHKLRRLQHLLLRIEATVEEAEGRYITNQAMLRQLEMLRQGMYGGHHMLDTLRYDRGGHGGIDNVRVGRTVAFSGFRLTRRTRNGDDMDMQQIVLDAQNVRKLENVLDDLETLMGDMKEFILFLEGYPHICRQPYTTYLIVGKVMFGRQMEMETIINFLLRPESADETPGVLPIVGAVRVGKNTLVEHVCLDERVRGYFSTIVFFTEHDLGAGNMAALKGKGVIKHQHRTASSHGIGRLLAVIELAGDVNEETWKRLYTSAASFMENGSKIIVTSRSEKITAFGTVQALRLKYLTEEAFWYFFKAVAFGSANPEDHPKLASIGMEIALLLKGAFLGANVVGNLMRANQNHEFWSRLHKRLKDFTSQHLVMYGEDPTDLIRKDQPVCSWGMAREQHAITCLKMFRMRSPQNCVPELPTSEDVLSGRVTVTEGEFSMVSWRSTIPPYNTYLARCVSQKIRCPIDNKKRRRGV